METMEEQMAGLEEYKHATCEKWKKELMSYSRYLVQSWTTKVHIFNNSQTRVFGYKLTSDSDSAPPKTPRNGCF